MTENKELKIIVKVTILLFALAWAVGNTFGSGPKTMGAAISGAFVGWVFGGTVWALLRDDHFSIKACLVGAVFWAACFYWLS